MKRILVFILTCALLFGITSYAKEEEPKQLYAQSAVLMDADSGRVLFEKNGYEQKAMASTTKIMTCILALEKGKPDQIVTVSENCTFRINGAPFPRQRCKRLAPAVRYPFVVTC